MGIPHINASTGTQVSSNTQSTYGGGLGPIYTYGHANPYGPYSFLPRPGQSPPIIGGSRPGGSGSTTTTSGNADAEGWLGKVLTGDNLPYNQQNINAMTGQQANMSAAAEAGQNQQLTQQAAASGASASDPSMKFAQRQNMDRRQQANMQAKQNIEAQAKQQNFNAQLQAADILNKTKLQREGWAQNANSAAMSFLPWNRGNADPAYNNTQGNSYINFMGWR